MGGGPPGGVCALQPTAARFGDCGAAIGAPKVGEGGRAGRARVAIAGEGAAGPDAPPPPPAARAHSPSPSLARQVALLFLTAGTLPHAPAWEAWLDRAAGVVPADCAAAAACAGARAAAAARSALSTCDASAPSLFSVHVHVPLGVDLEVPPASRFAAAVVSDRVATEWGGFTLADATRRLLAAALADPRAQRFVLLSESCVPLYSPQVGGMEGGGEGGGRVGLFVDEDKSCGRHDLPRAPRSKPRPRNPPAPLLTAHQTAYAQLMYNPKSRVNACPDGVKADWPLDEYRYTWRMADATRGALTADKWRKSHQWIGLVRKHAAAVAGDEEVAAAFRAHCTNAPDPDLGGAWRSCFSDEHYFPTLLALRGWDAETDCEGDGTHTVWCRGWHCVGDAKLHPQTHAAKDVNVSLLLALRRSTPVSIGAVAGALCADGGAAAAAAGLLAPAAAIVAGAGPPPGARPAADPAALVGGRCSLFARKFKADAAPAARDAVAAVCAVDDEAAAQAAG